MRFEQISFSGQWHIEAEQWYPLRHNAMYLVVFQIHVQIYQPIEIFFCLVKILLNRFYQLCYCRKVVFLPAVQQLLWTKNTKITKIFLFFCIHTQILLAWFFHLLN